MDDQFNGRTDDDLFADDFEPVEEQTVVEVQPVAEPAPPVAASVVAESQPPIQSTPSPAPLQSIHASSAPSGATSSTPRYLAHSRHAPSKPAPSKPAHKPRQQQQQRKQSPHRRNAQIKSAPVPAPAASTDNSTVKNETSTPAAIDTNVTTEIKSQPSPSNATATSHSSTKNDPSASAPATAASGPGRLASGANPRTKLTDTELAQKMEQMKIASAERTRKFEQAERDSQSHAVAYERGMEELRRRRAEEAERRRRGDEERRRMDEERAANRERKLRAIGAHTTETWDDGKLHDDRDVSVRSFRGANGGVRGARGDGRGAGAGETREVFSADEFRGGGRGGRSRGGRGGGRGGRRGGGHYDGERGAGPQYNSQNDSVSAGPLNGNSTRPNKKDPAPQAVPTEADFPELPPSTAKHIETSLPSGDAMKFPSLSPGGNEGPLGKWDDEMEALDAKRGI